MVLSYRGVPYQKTQLEIDIDEGPLKGKYRGQEWNEHYPRHMVTLAPKPPMTYRGIAVGRVEARPLREEIACPITLHSAPKTMSNDLSQTHLENMRQSLERRLKIAQEKGDRALLQMLEQESKQLSVS